MDFLLSSNEVTIYDNLSNSSKVDIEPLIAKGTKFVNEDILGGFILRIGDKQYNASIANKLNKLKREFTLN